MDLRGDEKRIQALFSELSLEDQTIAPRFEQLWNRAQPTKAESRSFTRPIIALASLLFIAVWYSLAVWSNYKSVESVPSVALVDDTSAPKYDDVVFAAPKKSRRFKRQRKTGRSITQQAALLSSWQSPTEIFMTSPTTLVLSSLPQLDQSANQLKQFLPKGNDVMKESNQ